MTKAQPARIKHEEQNPTRQTSGTRSAWQLQAAKARFSEVFRLARTEGPQLITRQGKDGVVMLPVEQFDELVNRSRPRKNIVDFFRESPLFGVDLDLERDKDPGRDIEL